MEGSLSSQDEEMPIPMNSTYGHTHTNTVVVPNSVSQLIPSNGQVLEDQIVPYKKMVKYKECLKNHAAAMGGNATDGCGEFMPNGQENTLEALTCSACNCHRNFHRKETHCDTPFWDTRGNLGRKLIMGHQFGTPCYPTSANASLVSPGAIVSFPMEYDDNGHRFGTVTKVPHLMRKRHRTKFSQEQKEKMFNFAEKAGWKIQKQEESVVQQFCQEVGVKRRVLKVWMHNNKHNLAKKNSNSTPVVQNPELI